MLYFLLVYCDVFLYDLLGLVYVVVDYVSMFEVLGSDEWLVDFILVDVIVKVLVMVYFIVVCVVVSYVFCYVW